MELNNEILAEVSEFSRSFWFTTNKDESILVRPPEDVIKIKINPRIPGTLISSETTPKHKRIITLTVRNEQQKKEWQKSIRKKRQEIRKEKEKILKAKPRDISPP